MEELQILEGATWPETRELVDVRIVTFPETQVASITHLGPPEDEHVTVRKLIAWKLKNQLLDPEKHRHFGLHYFDTGSHSPEDHRVDFCLSVAGDVADEPHGMVRKTIPRMRCACAQDIGSRENNKAAAYLVEKWLPASGAAPSGYPMIFHYVNVGPSVKPEEAITDVYMPLK